MTNFKHIGKRIGTHGESVHGEFKIDSSEPKKPEKKVKLKKPVDISKVPKEQQDKLESFIKQWENPSNWYESRIEGFEWFLDVAEKNDVEPEAVEFVVKKNSQNMMICKPELIETEGIHEKDPLSIKDLDRLRKFLILYPQYKSRVENGENVADIAISIVKKHLEEEEKRSLGQD